VAFPGSAHVQTFNPLYISFRPILVSANPAEHARPAAVSIRERPPRIELFTPHKLVNSSTRILRAFVAFGMNSANCHECADQIA
jgi:hypothetical protein